MKKFFTLLLPVFLLMFGGNIAIAQMVGDNVFLQGAYVELGIAPNGAYGSTLPAPTGYHPYLGPGVTFNFYDPAAGTSTTSSQFLGFVADYGRDGWTVGTPPFFGDYYLPGDPQEGWAIEVNGLEADAYMPAFLTTGTTGYTGGMTGTNVSYSNSGGIIQGVWQGNFGALAIRQTTTLDTTKLYFTVNVVLTNTGATPLTNIYYLRTVDPDNEETRVTSEPVGTPYTTINSITYQLPSPENKVLVSATGETYLNDYLGLGTKDCRAKCVIYNDASLTPDFSLDSIYNESENLVGEDYFYTQGQIDTQDVGIGLAFNIGILGAGDSTTLSYAYILNATYIDSALNSITPQFLVNSTLEDSTYSLNLCASAPDTVNIYFPGGGFYTWTWFPDSFVHAVTGTNFIISKDSITHNMTYTIIGANVAGGCDSIIYHLTLDHAEYNAPGLTPTSYCQGDVAVPLTSPVISTDTIVTWYTTPTGGGASSTPPTPPTGIATTIVYYVVDSVAGLCYSNPIPDTVVIRPLPVPPELSDPNPYCQGQAFVPISAIGSDIRWYPGPIGGVAGTVTPIVNTNIPGTDTFYATQTIAYTTPNVISCESPRQMLTITVLDSVVPSFTYAIHYGCKADTVLFNNTSRGGTRYTWQFGDGASDTTTSPGHVYLLQDTFSVELTAITRQCSDSMVQQVPLVHPLKAGFTFTPAVVCQKDTAVFTNTSIGTGLRYEWLFGNGVTDDSDVNPVYSYHNSGVYQVQLVATDFVPCHDTATGTIYIDSISSIGMSVTDSVICRATDITFTGLFTSIGNIGETWYFGNGDSVSNVNPVTYAYDVTGTYTVSVKAHFRTCRDTGMSKSFTIYSAPSVNLGGDTSICPGSAPLVLGDNVNAQHPGESWTWNTGQTTPSITVTTPGQYYVTADMDGCNSTDTIIVRNDCYMDIPNVFTPNGDGLNDYFYPMQYLSKGVASFKMDIYNRWGQLVFEGTTLDGRGWDGKFNGEDQPDGVYVYVIDATFVDGQKEHHNGNVTLLR